MNQIILVGRLVKTPEVVTTESGKNMSYITLAISAGVYVLIYMIYYLLIKRIKRKL